MRYYIIAGEASGDLHGSNLIKELRKIDSDSEFRAWGGDKMKEAGANIVRHYKDHNYMGFVEVFLHLRKILSNISACKKDILSFKPDVIIFIDFPGFNLRIADWAKKQGFKTAYYISPQIWAWKTSRVHLIKKCIDQMIVILPFEKDFYAKFDYQVEYVGHPLLDEINPENKELNFEEKKQILLLPGSRRQEIKNMLPVMSLVAKQFTEYQFTIAAVNNIEESFYKKHIKSNNIKIEYNNLSKLLSNTHSAIVTSGTATLETALYNVPMIVCYKSNYLSYLIAKKLIKVKFISLVNLIMNKKVVTELIQKEMNISEVSAELRKISDDTSIRNTIFANYFELRKVLQNKGASTKAAQIIFNKFKN